MSGLELEPRPPNILAIIARSAERLSDRIGEDKHVYGDIITDVDLADTRFSPTFNREYDLRESERENLSYCPYSEVTLSLLQRINERSQEATSPRAGPKNKSWRGQVNRFTFDEFDYIYVNYLLGQTEWSRPSNEIKFVLPPDEAPSPPGYVTVSPSHVDTANGLPHCHVILTGRDTLDGGYFDYKFYKASTMFAVDSSFADRDISELPKLNNPAESWDESTTYSGTLSAFVKLLQSQYGHLSGDSTVKVLPEKEQIVLDGDAIDFATFEADPQSDRGKVLLKSFVEKGVGKQVSGLINLIEYWEDERLPVHKISRDGDRIVLKENGESAKSWDEVIDEYDITKITLRPILENIRKCEGGVTVSDIMELYDGYSKEERQDLSKFRARRSILENQSIFIQKSNSYLNVHIKNEEYLPGAVYRAESLTNYPFI